ncbi:hypothetical protein FACS1894102_2720 [Spirochaetia bacterium]|nr:hypothetical protein FACS1894102_2720 [Spirochaetia bacterium]
MIKKTTIKITLLCFFLVAIFSTVIIINRHDISLSPWETTKTLDWWAYATENEERIAVSGNGKETVIVLDKNNELIYRLDADRSDPKSFSGVVFLALDELNNLYVLDWHFGGVGVDNIERVLKYDAEGNFVKELYSYKYLNDVYIFSKGKTIGFSYFDGYIYTVRDERYGFYFEKIAVDGDPESREVLFYHYPNALADFRYFHINPATKHLTTVTKSGTIKRFDFDGKEIDEWAAYSNTSPFMAISDKDNNIIFSDTIANEVVKINTKTKERSIIISSEEGLHCEEINYLPGRQGRYRGTLYAAPNTGFILAIDDIGTRKKTESYSISDSLYKQRWALFILLIADIVFLLATIVFFVLCLRNVKADDVFRQIILTSICILFAAVATAIFIVADINTRIQENTFANLENVSRLMSVAIDTDILTTIDDASDWDSPEYKKMARDTMAFFKKLDFTGQTIYQNIWMKRDATVYAVYDSENALGCYYPYDAYEGSYFQDAFENAAYIRESIPSASGSWVFVCGPIFDKGGNVVALIETGHSQKMIEEENKKTMIQTLLIVLSTSIIFLLFMIEMIIITNSWKKLKEITHLNNNIPVFRPELLRAVVFFLFFASNLATAFVPIYASQLYIPIFNMPHEFVVTLPFSANVVTAISALLVVPFLVNSVGIKKLTLGATVFFTIGSVLCWSATNVVVLALGYAINGFCCGTIVLCVNTIIGSQRETSVVTSGFAHFNAAYLAGINAGIVFGSMLAQFFPYRVVFLFAAIFAAILLALLTFAVRSVYTQAMFNPPLQECSVKRKSTGLIAFCFKPLVLCILCLILVPFMASYSFIDYFVPVFATDIRMSGWKNSLTESNVGQLILLNGLFAILFGTSLCEYVAKNLRIKTVVGFAILINAAGLYLFSIKPILAVLIVTIIFMAVANIFALTNIQTYFSSLYQLYEVDSTKALSIYSIFENLAIGIGPVVFSYVLSGNIIFGIKTIVFVLLTALLVFLTTSALSVGRGSAL